MPCRAYPLSCCPGRPVQGGFGTVLWQQHITGSHAKWAARYLRWAAYQRAPVWGYLRYPFSTLSNAHMGSIGLVHHYAFPVPSVPTDMCSHEWLPHWLHLMRPSADAN